MAVDREPIETPQPEGEGPRPFAARTILTALGTVAAVVVVVLFAAYHTCAFTGCPDIDQIRGYVPDEASVVLDRDDEEIGKLFRVNRVVVEVESLPEFVAHAFVAIEDQQFYDHNGVDFSRVMGAAWQNVRSGAIEQGFSTITMQVARNVFPEQLPANERTLSRKISEVKVARKLESRYGKDDILELYLNQIYFGSGAWGIQAAAREYFGKDASDLELSEAALLAGLPQAPSRLNPRENMAGALDRRQRVLDRMVEQGVITSEEAAAAGDAEPDLARSTLETPDRAAYFMEHVRQVLEQRLGDALYTRGFTIHTTLDLDAQAVAERELAEQLQAIEAGRFGYFRHATYAGTGGSVAAAAESPYLQGAVVVLDVRSGDVLAMVGGRDFEQSKFNRAVQALRQPGSAFKPFVYAAAIQAGLPPTTILEDTPYRVVRDGRVWEPGNYGGSYSGPITMRQALVQSKNVATIRLAEQVGIRRVVDMARQLGISGDIPPYPSVAIGAAEVTLIDMVAAYSALATLGVRPEPRFITQVTDQNGVVVLEERPVTRQVLDSDVAFLTVDLMRDVVDRGTGTPVRGAGFRGAAAGKTGTTNENADVWFIGFTPEIAAGVWIGMDDPQRIIPNATGGRLAAPVWGRIMRTMGSGGNGWSPPPGIESLQVDEYGNAVAANCPTYGVVREEYFLRGTARVHDCFDFRYPYGDSLYGDSIYRDADDESWWRRLRDRLFDDDRERADSLRRQTHPDTIIMRSDPDPRDTIRLRPTPPDTTPRPIGRDTILLDTIPRPPPRPPDTTPPPDSSAGPIGDSLGEDG